MSPDNEESVRARVRALCEHFVAGEGDEPAHDVDDDEPMVMRGSFVHTGPAPDGTLRHARARSLARRSNHEH